MVYYDLSESKYKLCYNYLTFYFSSEFNLNRFTKQYIQYLKTETLKLQSKYKCIVECDDMILLQLYKKIEKRGFRVEIFKEELEYDYIVRTTILK